jgi:uncharacterized protein (TIGR02594 family)
MPDPRWLLSALADLGVKEAPGVTDNPRVVAYHKATDGGDAPDAIAWCSSFVCYHVEHAGHRSTRSKAARSWVAFGTTLEEPRLGAIAVLSRGANPALGHVGFWIAGDADVCWLLGGNQSDAVTIAPFLRSRLVAVRWPIT